MRQISILREARSIFPRKGNKILIIDANDRKLFIRVINIILSSKVWIEKVLH